MGAVQDSKGLSESYENPGSFNHSLPRLKQRNLCISHVAGLHSIVSSVEWAVNKYEGGPPSKIGGQRSRNFDDRAHKHFLSIQCHVQGARGIKFSSHQGDGSATLQSQFHHGNKNTPLALWGLRQVLTVSRCCGALAKVQ